MDKITELGMLQRIDNFLKAMKKPNKRIGKHKVKFVEVPVFPKSPKSVQRFDQLNREDRWSKVEFKNNPEARGATRIGQGSAHISVQDPRDIDDIVLPNVNVDDA